MLFPVQNQLNSFPQLSLTAQTKRAVFFPCTNKTTTTTYSLLKVKQQNLLFPFQLKTPKTI